MTTTPTAIRPIFEQISELGDKCPNLIALKRGDREVTYAELARKADQFAGYLMQLADVRGGTVAICIERSFDWIVAALGTMRAGAAYVPLDPAWPDSRLRFAVEDSDAIAVVARTALFDRLQCKAHGIDPYHDATAIASAPRAPRSAVDVESLAYLIYTSGSTGVPKGVEITHANLMHLSEWHRAAFGVRQQDRASHLAGLGFDAAGWEIWPNLAAGATVCVADDEVRSSPELLQRWMLQEGITIGFVPTVHAQPMMAMQWPETTGLRFLLTGGDVLHRSPAVELPFAVVNNYGPTECTVVATSMAVKPGLSGRPPIGHPIAGASVYLLNESGEQVPDGDLGEIYIGGGGVGRGYRNLPESTERSFLPDPFSTVRGARMYRSGDLGIRRPDGTIEFHGRIDRQTKIRGQRVELDEIASVLAHHPSIEFATAITKSTQGGDARLIAYVLPKEDVTVPTAVELQTHLQSSLPDYMIPSIFVRLEDLPLSPNGKLDVSRLAQPTEANSLKKTPAKAPATAIEEKLLAIVQELLEDNAIRAEDNFFLAGGHSLWGMQLLMRLRTDFGVNLTVQQVFEAPTVERLASFVEMKLIEARIAAIWKDLLGVSEVGLDVNFFDAGGRAELGALLQRRVGTEFNEHIPITELLRKPTVREQANLIREHVKTVIPPGVLVLQPNGTRNTIFWIHYLSPNLAKAMGDDQPFIHVELTAEDFKSLGSAPSLQAIAACLVLKILTMQSKGPYVIGGFCLGGIVAYEIASQLRAAGDEVSPLLIVDTPPESWYYKSPSLIEANWYQARYLVKKAFRLGLRVSLARFRERLNRVMRKNRTRTETEAIQETIEAAASRYQPEKYDGRVVLLLPTEHPPHINFLPGWQKLVPHGLHASAVSGYNSEFMGGEDVANLAKAIVSQLNPSSGEQFIPRDALPIVATTVEAKSAETELAN